MVFKNTEDIKREIDLRDKKASQLLTLRWQALGIIFALSSAFWFFLLGRIIDTSEIGDFFLLFIFGIIFSIMMILLWRYVTHLLSDEESLYLDMRYIFEILLHRENSPNYSEDDYTQEIEKIRKKELKIRHLEDCLSREFDDFYSTDLSKKFFTLDANQRYDLAEKIDYKYFENGQRKFDLYFFIVIFVSWFIGMGIWCSMRMLDMDTTFQLYNDYKFGILCTFLITLIVLGIFIWLYFVQYIIPNKFLFLNSARRREYIECLMERIIEKVNLEC